MHANDHYIFAEIPTSDVVKGKNYNTNLSFLPIRYGMILPVVEVKGKNIFLCSVENINSNYPFEDNWEYLQVK